MGRETSDSFGKDGRQHCIQKDPRLFSFSFPILLSFLTAPPPRIFGQAGERQLRTKTVQCY